MLECYICFRSSQVRPHHRSPRSGQVDATPARPVARPTRLPSVANRDDIDIGATSEECIVPAVLSAQRRAHDAHAWDADVSTVADLSMCGAAAVTRCCRMCTCDPSRCGRATSGGGFGAHCWRMFHSKLAVVEQWATRARLVVCMLSQPIASGGSRDCCDMYADTIGYLSLTHMRAGARADPN